MYRYFCLQMPVSKFSPKYLENKHAGENAANFKTN